MNEQTLTATIGPYTLTLEPYEHIPHAAFSRYFEAVRTDHDDDQMEENLARATLQLFKSARATKNDQNVNLAKIIPGALVFAIINLAEEQRQQVLDLGNFLRSSTVTSGTEPSAGE